MNITRNNFRDHFDELKEVINAANVLAIDCKFTGLSNDNSKIQQYDSPSEYLQKLSQQTSGYFAFEFGLTAFRAKGDDTQNFTYRSYNFSVFPQMRQQRLDCQGDSMAFLGAMNLDSNTMFLEGISYCDEEEAKRLRKQLDEKIKSMESIQRYAEKISASSHSEHHQKSQDQTLELQRQEIDTERKQMEDIIGFHNFINFLSQTKKLIVGHNLILDMIYTMKQFVSPMPTKLKDFKSKTHETFPNLLDTKYMCTDDTIKPYINSSALAELFDATSVEPFVRPTFEAEAAQYSYSLLHKPKEHKAGYDSFMTGVSFVTMANYLQVDSCDINENSTRLRPILNKLFLGIDVNHINLTGKERKLSKMSAPSTDTQTICDICKAVRPKKNLAKHKRICRGPDYINKKKRKPKHVCTMCKYETSQRRLLVQHMAHRHKMDTAASKAKLLDGKKIVEETATQTETNIDTEARSNDLSDYNDEPSNCNSTNYGTDSGKIVSKHSNMQQDNSSANNRPKTIEQMKFEVVGVLQGPCIKFLKSENCAPYCKYNHSLPPPTVVASAIRNWSSQLLNFLYVGYVQRYKICHQMYFHIICDAFVEKRAIENVIAMIKDCERLSMEGSIIVVLVALKKCGYDDDDALLTICNNVSRSHNIMNEIVKVIATVKLLNFKKTIDFLCAEMKSIDVDKSYVIEILKQAADLDTPDHKFVEFCGYLVAEKIYY